MSNSTDSPRDPKSFNAPGRQTLDDSDVGGVAQALLSLTRELWVVRDRLAVLEAVLSEKGIDVSEEIENFQPNEEMQKQLDEQAKIMVSRIVGSLNEGTNE